MDRSGETTFYDSVRTSFMILKTNIIKVNSINTVIDHISYNRIQFPYVCRLRESHFLLLLEGERLINLWPKVNPMDGPVFEMRRYYAMPLHLDNEVYPCFLFLHI